MLFFIIASFFIILLIFAYIIICKYNFQKLKEKPLCNPITRSSAEQSTKRVVIVGAGVAGIAAAKTFLRYGYSDVVLLERTNELGGVWNSSQYAGASIQGMYIFFVRYDVLFEKHLIILIIFI